MQTKPTSYRYLEFVIAAFICVLICSNLIGPAKVGMVELPDWLGGSLSFGAGNLFFPISYIIADILTEVYGYKTARRVIWMGFFSLLFASLMAQVIINMPVDPSEPYNAVLQPALETAFGGTWRIVLASMVAYFVGDFVNAFIMAKMKIWTKGKHLWSRTIGSTVAGQGVDSMIFYPLAFYGVWSNETLVSILVFNFFFKVMLEVLMTPATYVVVNKLKKAEGVDVYDTDTNFTPFKIADR